MKGVYRHVSNAEVGIETKKECVKSVGKVHHILGGSYFSVYENNCLRDVGRVIMRWLEDTCRVSDAQRRVDMFLQTRLSPMDV